MNEERYEYFQRMSVDEKLKLKPSDFTISEFKGILGEIMLKEECKQIAIMYYVDCMTYDDIAYKLQIDRKTVIRNLNHIVCDNFLIKFQFFL